MNPKNWSAKAQSIALIVIPAILAALNAWQGWHLDPQLILGLFGLGAVGAASVAHIDNGEPADPPPRSDPAPTEEEKAHARKILGIAPVFTLVCALALTGCGTLSQFVAPPAEDIFAVRAAAERLPELVAADAKVYRTAVQGLASAARTRAHAEAAQAADYQLLVEGAPADSAGVPFPVGTWTRGEAPAQLHASGERVRQILDVKAAQERAADESIDRLVAATTAHEVHVDLDAVVELLRAYLAIRMTDDERKAALAAQAHDLIYSKKAVR